MSRETLVCVSSYVIKMMTVAFLASTPFIALFVSYAASWSALLFMVWLVHGSFVVTVAWAVCPFVCLWCYYILLVESLSSEVRLIEQVGADQALWTYFDNRVPAGHPLKWVARVSVCRGWDTTQGILADFCSALGVQADWAKNDGVRALGSRAWSFCIMGLHRCVSNPWVHYTYVGGLAYLMVHLCRVVSGVFWRWAKVALVAAFVAWAIPAHFYFEAAYGFVRAIVAVTSRGVTGEFLALTWLKWRFTLAAVRVAGYTTALNSEVSKYYSAKVVGDAKGFMPHFKSFTIHSVRFIDSVALPSFIRNRMHRDPTLPELKASQLLMKSLGWPINVELKQEGSAHSEPFKEWLLCGSDFATGIRNMRAMVDEDLEKLRPASVLYKRTESYKSHEGELEATSRYFVNRNMTAEVDVTDDVWEVLRPIFADSRLTPFNYIIKMWEKKYALGAWMRSLTHSRSKYKRSDFIRDFGGFGPFKELWRRTFVYASLIYPTAHVSVKDESLPEKKWAKGLVRTITGSPITQYILSTIWNYGPNHRFAWDSTPIKVGMPLNGYYLTEVWKRHARCQIHVEGDFTAFDSTISGAVLDLIKHVRKKGFEHHKDHHGICDLIDVNYDQVARQTLNLTSTGDVYRKGSGLTTGHSSTSMDNSIALVSLYLLAWKELTGLSAREFLHYNELSCYGDDHILSILQFRPMVWTPKNIARTMARWGVTNNLEIKKLEDTTFLKKKGRHANQTDLQRLSELGVTDVRFLVWHDKMALLGKLTSQVKSMNPTYKVKRLLSFLTLTAHHPDIYAGITGILNGSSTMKMILKHNKLKVPTYAQIVRSWYSPSATSRPWVGSGEPAEEFENSGEYIQVGLVSPVDAVLGALSLVPDLVNPAIFNYGYGRALQMWLSRYLLWAVDFMHHTNSCTSLSHLQAVLNKSPYRVLTVADLPVGASQATKSEQLLRHWLFVLYCRVRPIFKGLAWVNFLVAKTASVQFALNGRIFEETKSTEATIDQLVVLALLAFVPAPSIIEPLWEVSLPDLGLLIDLATHFAVVTMWSSVPPNFQPVNVALRQHSWSSGPVLVEAPTGVGKSTSLISFLWAEFGSTYDRIIVIEPRSLLVRGLVPYMRNSYGLPVSGSTTGMSLDESQKVWYMTPQSLCNRLEFLTGRNLFVLDEAHLDEPFYKFFRNIFAKASLPSIWLTATPTPTMIASCGLHCPLVNAGLFRSSVHTVRAPAREEGWTTPNIMHDYEKWLLSFAKTLSVRDVCLAFVPTIQMARRLAQAHGKRGYALSSEDSPPPGWPAGVYFSTNVADVGITIPGLTHVLFANFSHLEGGQLVSLPASASKQRAGRTGRTNNGFVYIREYPVPFSGPSNEGPLSSNDWKELALSSAPADLLFAMDANSALWSVGVDPGLVPKDKMQDVKTIFHVIRANFMPVLQQHLQSDQLNDPSFGPSVTILPGSAGEVDYTLPQSSELTAESTLDATGAVILEYLRESVSVKAANALERWNSTNSVHLTVPSLTAQMVKDPQADPESWDVSWTRAAMAAGSDFLDAFRQGTEIAKIVRLLNDEVWDDNPT